MMDLVTAGWFNGDKFVRMHDDGTLEVSAAGMVYRATINEWLGNVPAKPGGRPLPHMRRGAKEREPGEDG